MNSRAVRNGAEGSAVAEERKRKVKRKRQRVRRVWTAEEWLSKVDWGRFGPQTPKRQAWELIRRLADTHREPFTPNKDASWVGRVRGDI